MTALTTGLTLLPFALFGNIPGHEMVYPMAIIIIGGLVTSTLLNLFLLPALGPAAKLTSHSSAPEAAICSPPLRMISTQREQYKEDRNP
jgi:Cu/Ag efflux pump CusA